MQITDLVYIDSTGYHYADYPAFLEWRQNQIKAIYGEDTYIDPDSQDGQLLAVQALADYQTAARGAAIYNSFSPLTAQGTGLSRVVKINGMKRQVPTNSQVDVDIVGQSGTIITDGVVQDTLDQKWNLPSSVLIPGGGTITVTAVAQEVGAVLAEAGTVNKIFTPTLGWQSVTNPLAATAGAPVESDALLRLRQAQSTAIPSLTVFDGTIGAVQNIAGVTKVRGYENDTGSTDGNGIPAHSICVIASGGDAFEIATQIAVHKTPGTGTYGNTSEDITDSHGMPLTINFSRPTTATIKVTITLAAGTGWSTDYVALIKQSMVDHINSLLIGATVLITKMYGPAYLLGTPAGQTYDIATLEIAKNAGPLGTSNISLAFDENPVCTTADVTVIVT